MAKNSVYGVNPITLRGSIEKNIIYKELTTPKQNNKGDNK